VRVGVCEGVCVCDRVGMCGGGDVWSWWWLMVCVWRWGGGGWLYVEPAPTSSIRATTPLQRLLWASENMKGRLNGDEEVEVVEKEEEEEEEEDHQHKVVRYP
jgi:hypothetical protein